MKSQIQWIRQNRFSLCLSLIAMIAILWTGMVYDQHVFRMIPIGVSLLVGVLQTKANRYACLIGGCNSVLYAVVYASFGLYASAASALFVSCPFQLVTFVRWNKRAYRHSTEFRSLKKKQWLLLAIVFIVSFLGMYLLLSAVSSKHRLWDVAGTLVGFFVSVLTLLRYREYSWLILPSSVLGLGMNVSLMLEDPAQVTYVIYSIQSAICQILQFHSVRKLYREQQKNKEECI